jgi:flagellar motor component MotA
MMATVLLGIFIHTLLTQPTALKLEEMIDYLEQQLDIIWEGVMSE